MATILSSCLSHVEGIFNDQSIIIFGWVSNWCLPMLQGWTKLWFYIFETRLATTSVKSLLKQNNDNIYELMHQFMMDWRDIWEKRGSPSTLAHCLTRTALSPALVVVPLSVPVACSCPSVDRFKARPGCSFACFPPHCPGFRPRTGMLRFNAC